MQQPAESPPPTRQPTLPLERNPRDEPTAFDIEPARIEQYLHQNI